MYIRTYVRTYVRMYVCMHACMMYVYGWMDIRMYVCMSVCTYVCLYVCLAVCVCVCVCVCMCVCVYVCMHVFLSIADGKAYRDYKERFSEDDVEASFLYLLSKLEALWSEVDFSELRKICKRDDRLSNELRSDVKKAPNLEETFDLLTTSPFCTWLELRILKRMAKVANVPEASDMINIFEECVHKRKCSEVKPYFKKRYINPDHLTVVEAKLNKSADDLIVSDLIKFCHKLESIFGIPAESSIPISSEEGCLEICFAIPTYCCLHAYEIAKSNFFELRPIHIRYLQIGIFPRIYAVGQETSRTDNSFLKWITSSFDKCKFMYCICMHTYMPCFFKD